jgi:hypothetical protein
VGLIEIVQALHCLKAQVVDLIHDSVFEDVEDRVSLGEFGIVEANYGINKVGLSEGLDFVDDIWLNQLVNTLIAPSEGPENYCETSELFNVKFSNVILNPLDKHLENFGSRMLIS